MGGTTLKWTGGELKRAAYGQPMAPKLAYHLPDGAQAGVKGCRWELTTASGKHYRGTAETEEAAKQSALAVYFGLVQERWLAGCLGRRGGFSCKVT